MKDHGGRGRGRGRVGGSRVGGSRVGGRTSTFSLNLEANDVRRISLDTTSVILKNRKTAYQTINTISTPLNYAPTEYFV
jgi:hypothetical protein